MIDIADIEREQQIEQNGGSLRPQEDQENQHRSARRFRFMPPSSGSRHWRVLPMRFLVSWTEVA